VDGIQRCAELFVKSRRGLRVLEPACGSGRYLRVLAGRGVAGLGFDLSGPMIEYARRRAARLGVSGLARYEIGSMTDFLGTVAPARGFTLAINLINSVRHLGSDAAMLEHFAQTARALAPRGVYLVGLSTSAPGLEMPSEDVWAARRGGARVVQTVQYIPPETDGSRTERVVSHVRVETPTGSRDSDAAYTLRTYSHAQWHDLIARSDLRLRAVVNETGDPVDAPECGYALYVLGADG